ncbi:MAG: bifunctional phosphoribosylaminoimidazolecarboxamide formyltransferase/IMP cyclohydrolase [Ignavibacteria bacterium]
MKRALISVYKKDGIVELSKFLVDNGFEIISTGGTYSYLIANGIAVTEIEKITSFPEILDGRVKTLHPHIFAGILYDRENSAHQEFMGNMNLSGIDVVVVNLYPFEETVKQEGCTLAEAIEKIDIGGISLIRAAAKNFKSVSILVEPKQYQEFINVYTKFQSNLPDEYKLRLAYEAFLRATVYDSAITEYFKHLLSDSEYPDFVSLDNLMPLRYGENPHQKGFLVKQDFDKLFKVLHGKELSYNNLLDINAALQLIAEFNNELKACAIIKHGNPCGVALSNVLRDAYLNAYSSDPVSAFGGIVIFNRRLDFETAAEVDRIFTEIIMAPEFDKEALNLLFNKKNRRIIQYKNIESTFELRKVAGGYLLQDTDKLNSSERNLKCVTTKVPSDKEILDLLFAEKVAKHTKSNAVVFVKDGATLGIGGGQPSRVDSTRIAIMKAKQFGKNLDGSAVASDAFFPFPDGVVELAKAGASCVIQPGGSIRDDEVIKAADENGLAMVFSGIRHFKH